MKKEKSCGAVVYRKGETGMEVLLIKHKNGGHEQLVEHSNDDANGGNLKNEIHFHEGVPPFPVLV